MQKNDSSKFIQVKNTGSENIELLNFQLSHPLDLEFLAHSDKLANKYVNAILVVGVDDNGKANLACGFKDPPPPHYFNKIILKPNDIHHISAPMQEFYQCHDNKIKKMKVLLVRAKIVGGGNKLSDNGAYHTLFESNIFEMPTIATTMRRTN